MSSLLRAPRRPRRLKLRPRQRASRHGATSKRVVVASLVVVAVALFAAWRWHASQAAAREAAGSEELAQAGALVVMDGERRHVASVNLSLIGQASDDAAAQSLDARLDRAVELLASFPHLTALDVSRTNFSDRHAKTIGGLSRLQSLTANNTQITDAALADLSAAGRLEALHLSNTKISADGIASLAKLNQLKVLDVSGTRITGGLEPIATFPMLEWLVMRRLTLEGDALAALATSPSLRRVSLEESTIDAGSLDALRKVRPELNITAADP